MENVVMNNPAMEPEMNAQPVEQPAEQAAPDVI